MLMYLAGQVLQHSLTGLSRAPGLHVLPQGTDLFGACLLPPLVSERVQELRRYEHGLGIFAPKLGFYGRELQLNIVQALLGRSEVALVGAVGSADLFGSTVFAGRDVVAESAALDEEGVASFLG
ncbi:hypothetical protein [Nonomuraea sp. SYSU D8015]|uniref:hypothetical protein n=1 Tax=Nonomuraea sp. SYSU D8015 TaxID=2593644 RepID=UPI0016614170|nr:hypothetical protein [Nonomuraea sp. SYSU D8015]